MAARYKSYLDLGELENYNRFKDAFIYSLGYSYAIAIFLQLKLSFSLWVLAKILFGLFTLKITFGIFTLFAINILLLNSYGHVQYNELELQLWPILEIAKQRNTLFVWIAGYYFASWVGMKVLLSLAVKDPSEMWIYPEGESGPPQLAPKHVLLSSFICVFCIAYAFTKFFSQSFHLRFEIINQKRAFVLRESIVSAIKFSFKFGLRMSFWFYVFYATFGNIIYIAMSNLVSQLYRTAGYEIDNPIYKFNICVTILLHSVLTAFILELTFHLYKQLMTEPANLSSSSSNPQKSLIEGLKLENDPIFQYWAFMELYNISTNDQARRKNIYFNVDSSASTAWSEISSVCLNILNSSMETTSRYLEDSLSKVEQPASSASFVSQSLFSSSKTQPIDSEKSQNNTGGTSLLGFESRLYKFLNSNIQNASLRRLLFNGSVNYKQFINIKLQIYSVRILSNFVVASADEDQYGQVLKTIPLILKSLLAYLDVLVQLSNFGPNAQSATSILLPNSTSDDSFIVQTSIKEVYILIQVLRSSIYAITARFYEHLTEFNLDPKSKKQLQYFVDWKA